MQQEYMMDAMKSQTYGQRTLNAPTSYSRSIKMCDSKVYWGFCFYKSKHEIIICTCIMIKGPAW